MYRTQESLFLCYAKSPIQARRNVPRVYAHRVPVSLSGCGFSSFLAVARMRPGIRVLAGFAFFGDSRSSRVAIMSRTCQGRPSFAHERGL